MSSHRRRGTTIIEFVVACTLLGSLMLFVVPTAIRNGRLQQMIRHDRIAMDEVTNQLDRLAQLPLNQIKQDVARLTPSEFAVAGLPNPKIDGTLLASEEGYRLALEVSWNSPGRSVAPLTMATWIYRTSTTETLVPFQPYELGGGTIVVQPSRLPMAGGAPAPQRSSTPTLNSDKALREDAAP